MHVFNVVKALLKSRLGILDLGALLSLSNGAHVRDGASIVDDTVEVSDEIFILEHRSAAFLNDVWNGERGSASNVFAARVKSQISMVISVHDHVVNVVTEIFAI